MTHEDKSFMTQFAAVLGGLVIIAIICFIIASSVADEGLVTDESAVRLAALQRIRPAGRVVTAGSAEQQAGTAAASEAAATAAPAAAIVVARLEELDLGQGETVYKSACFACHDTGVAGSPKLGDAAVWEPRIAQGLQTLVDRAINGFQNIGFMPPKGGNPTLSDQEVAAAVGYMVTHSQ